MPWQSQELDAECQLPQVAGQGSTEHFPLGGFIGQARQSVAKILPWKLK